MGFDNECILNIQSLAGEYFCPVCRTLVYPHEAIQTQCTHLYCKPCLSYVVSSTQACPYDGYLVTEAGSKPLMESNKALAETIGKTTVHCLYHRSGCVWQGPLSECTTHCSGCAFGNSPVVCNRCGIQIVHRQVQEHAQSCNVNGTNTQPQQGTEAAQDAAAASGVAVSTDQSKIINQAAPPASQSQQQQQQQPQASHTTTTPPAAQNMNQPPATVNPAPQAMPATAVPTPDQWYQQQYQQYYQQYPGYDPYQQQGYQQYNPYQQPPAQQFQPPPLQPQSQPQLQPQVQPQPQAQNHPLTQAQSNGQTQPLYPQVAVVGSIQNQAQLNPQGQPHMQIQSQNQPVYSQVQPLPVQNHPQPHMQVPQYQQPHPQMHHSQPPQVQQPPHPQPHPHFQPHPQPQPPVQSVGGHPSYPSQPPQQIQHAPPQQHPMQVQPPAGSLPPGQMPAQFPPPPPHMRPTQPPHMPAPGIPPTQQHIHSHNQTGLPPHQRPVMQPMPQQYMQQPQVHHSGPFTHQHSQVRPPGPPQPMQQPPLGFVQPQQGTTLPHGMPPHSSQGYVGRPPQFGQSSGAAGIPPTARPPQFGPSQPSVNQSNANITNQPHVYSEQQPNQAFERRLEQEDKSPSLKKPESVANDFGANYNEVKPVAGVNDEHKPVNEGEVDHRKDEALIKDAVNESHQVQGVTSDSVATQRVKEESKDGVLDHSPGRKSSHNKVEGGGVAAIESVKQGEATEANNGNPQGPQQGQYGQSQTTPQGQIGDVSGGFLVKGTDQSSQPHVPYALSGHQQRPAPNQPPTHIRPPGHGYLPPGPNQLGPFHSEFPLGGPPVPGSASTFSRGYEPHARLSQMSQGESLGPPLSSAPLPHHHPGPMDSDMYQNQRPPHIDSRRPDSHLPGSVDRGPYGQPPYGVESSSMRTNGPPLPGGGLGSSSAPVFRDENFRTPDTFPMAPTRHHDQGEFKRTFKQFPDSSKFGSHSSRPLSGYGMDGPSRFLDKDPHGYGYHSAGGLHPNESGGRPLPASMHDDNRMRFDNNHHNPDFHGPMHGFGRHHMDRLHPSSPGNPSRPFGGPHGIDVDGREMERHPFGERFPMGPPRHMHRGEFDGPGKPRSGELFGPRNLSDRPHMGEPGFGSFQDYGRSGESNGPGGFSHQPPFGEPFGTKSARPHIGEPGFSSSYSRQGFPSDGGFYAGGSDSFDPLRKRKPLSMGWCRICKIDCESVEGLDMHGQTREHQRMAMDMVISIKQKSAKKQKKSNDHSSREDASKLRNPEIHARVN